MKIEDLPFLIGEQYENWEFELELLPDRIKGMDSYKYIGKEVHKFLNYIPVQSELIFDLDILEIVILKFSNSSKKLMDKIISTRGELYINVDTKLEFKCCYYNRGVIVLYGNKEILRNLSSKQMR